GGAVRRRAKAYLVAAVLALDTLADGSAAPQAKPAQATEKSAAPPGTLRKDFGERVTVRETELVFGPDEDLKANEPASAFAVIEDGVRREGVRTERLKDETGRIVVYVDPRLVSAASGHLAALALSQASEDLAGR